MRAPFHRSLFAGSVLLWAAAGVAVAEDTGGWVTAWTTATFAETPGKDTPPLQNMTLRQVARVTVAGRAVRVRIGNYFGREPLVVDGGCVAVAGNPPPASAQPSRALRFSAHESVTIPPGSAAVSDPVDLPVKALTDLTVSLHLAELPKTLTGHSAARATSYVFEGKALPPAPDAVPAKSFTRFYFLAGIDVLNAEASAIAVFGDSIADGYGCAPDSFTRWPDVLARRLQENQATANIAVVNPSIGGNRLLRDGLGPRALTRVDRDVFAQHGVKVLVVSLGINDLGTRIEARKKSLPYASAEDIIGAWRELAARAHQRGLRVIGATLTPYAGAGFYWSEDGEADRQTVNRWIRETRELDAVIDFDAALRQPEHPERLAPPYDSGDHLHPSSAGYAEMGRVIDLAALLTPVLRRDPTPVTP